MLTARVQAGSHAPMVVLATGGGKTVMQVELARRHLAKSPDHVVLVVAHRIGRVEQAPNGARNDTLNQEAFGLARFIRSGDLGEDLVRRALLDAARVAGLPAVEAEKTVSSALRARKAQP